MRNNHVTPAFRPPGKTVNSIKGAMMHKLRRLRQKTEDRLLNRREATLPWNSGPGLAAMLGNAPA